MPVSIEIQDNFNLFYAKYGFYPESIQELADSLWGKERYSELEFFKGCFLIDPFLVRKNLFKYMPSPLGTGWYHETFLCAYFVCNSTLLSYFPIFDDINERPVSFVLLSVGEDGRIDSDVSEPLFVHDWLDRIRAYNMDFVLAGLEETLVAYPHYWIDGRVFHTVIPFDKNKIDLDKIPVKGDSIFGWHDFLNFQDSIRPYVGGWSLFWYPEFCRRRARFGRKDYVVAFGRNIIRFEVKTAYQTKSKSE